jgi:hypothetical protein
VLAISAPAAAEGTGSARPRPAPGKAARKAKPDVAAAIASGDDGRICRTAIDLGKAGDHVRAGLLVGACARLTDADAALADAARKTRIAVSRAATAGDWSKVEIVIRTEGATATVDAYPEIPLSSGSWRLPPGSYLVSATSAGGVARSELVLKDGNRSLVVLEPPPAPLPARHRTIDFTSGEPLPPPHAGPPVIKNESLIPTRFLKGLVRRPHPHK